MTDTIRTTDEIMQVIGNAKHGDDELLFTDAEVDRIRLGLELQDKRYALTETATGGQKIISRHGSPEEAQKQAELLAVGSRVIWIKDLLADPLG